MMVVRKGKGIAIINAIPEDEIVTAFNYVRGDVKVPRYTLTSIQIVTNGDAMILDGMNPFQYFFSNVFLLNFFGGKCHTAWHLAMLNFFCQSAFQ